MHTKAYKLGMLAALAGQKPGNCPFAKGLRRELWLTAYFLSRQPLGMFVVRQVAC